MLATDLSGTVWGKSSRSANNCACVEVALLSGGNVAVRDSKNPEGAALVFYAAEWDAFLGGVVDGEFTREALAARPQVPSPT